MPRVKLQNHTRPTGPIIPKPRRDTATAAARDIGQCVYAVRVKPDLIKIGCTTNLHQRIRTFGATWSDVLLALSADFEYEAALHRRFAQHVARGREFYHPAPEIMAWINTERECLGFPAA